MCKHIDTIFYESMALGDAEASSWSYYLLVNTREDTKFLQELICNIEGDGLAFVSPVTWKRSVYWHNKIHFQRVPRG